MAYNPDTLQPILPAPGAFTESELNYKDEEPPRLFPDNQDSNWGLLRRIYSDQVQNVRDQIDILYTERFVANANVLLTTWENEVGLPPNPPLLTIAQRRSNILNRLRIGPFTRERRKGVVESFFLATFGQPLQFLPPGIDLSNAAFYSEYSGAPSTLYRIYEDVRNFTYTVMIVNTSTPDIASMTRELTRITPAGISFTIDNSQSNILNYRRDVLSDSPIFYSRMDGTLTDLSGYANGITVAGTVPTVAGLIAALAAEGNQARSFNGVVGNYMIAFLPSFYRMSNPWTVEFLAKLNAIPASQGTFMSTGSGPPFIGVIPDLGKGALFSGSGGAATSSYTTGRMVVGTTYHIAVRRRPGADFDEIFLDGISVGNNATKFAYPSVAVNAALGGNFASSPINGVMDEFAVYDHALSDERILQHSNTSKGIL